MHPGVPVLVTSTGIRHRRRSGISDEHCALGCKLEMRCGLEDCIRQPSVGAQRVGENSLDASAGPGQSTRDSVGVMDAGDRVPHARRKKHVRLCRSTATVHDRRSSTSRRGPCGDESGVWDAGTLGCGVVRSDGSAGLRVLARSTQFVLGGLEREGEILNTDPRTEN